MFSKNGLDLNREHIFLDASVGALRIVYWSDLEKAPVIHCQPLSSTTPLSILLPPIWNTFVSKRRTSTWSQHPKKLFVLLGPGPLTSLRVLFAHIMGLTTAAKHLSVFGCPTPIWYRMIFEYSKTPVPESFVHQVGRFSFIFGNITQPDSYTTRHLRTPRDWQDSVSTTDSLPEPILLLAPQIPVALSRNNTFWINGAHMILPDLVKKTLDQFEPINDLSHLKPIQPH